MEIFMTRVLLAFSCLFFFNFSLLSIEKFVIFTIPRCGTELLIQAMEELSGKPSCYWSSHLPDGAFRLTEKETKQGKFVVAHQWDLTTLQSLIKKNYKIIFILRDPRDQLLSAVDWSCTHSWSGPLYIQGIKDRSKRIDEFILGRYGWRCYDFIKDREDIVNQLPEGSVLTVHFEYLIGPDGGGSRESQIDTLKKLAEWVDTTYNDADILEIAEALRLDNEGFNYDVIGRWRYEMTRTQIVKYHQLYQNELLGLGYETNSDWAQIN